MKRILFLVLLVCSAAAQSQTQGLEIELMGGVSIYSGDLNRGLIKPALGVNVKYRVSPFISFRGGLTYAQIGGTDKKGSKDDLKLRNLDFQSSLPEAHLAVEVNALDVEEFILYPYAFVGVGVYHIDPYTHDKNGEKTYLHPLSTEGQGLPSYGSVKPYSLTNICIPFGGGMKYIATDYITIGFEAGFRRVFTDYLDDVSTKYPDCETLTIIKGDKASELSFRGDELFGRTDDCPPAGATRGNSGKKDWYSFFGFTISYKIGARTRDTSNDW
jgi:hypothetical protein